MTTQRVFSDPSSQPQPIHGTAQRAKYLRRCGSMALCRLCFCAASVHPRHRSTRLFLCYPEFAAFVQNVRSFQMRKTEGMLSVPVFQSQSHLCFTHVKSTWMRNAQCPPWLGRVVTHSYIREHTCLKTSQPGLAGKPRHLCLWWAFIISTRRGDFCVTVMPAYARSLFRQRCAHHASRVFSLSAEVPQPCGSPPRHSLQ